jgi:hypothetical protein
MTLEDGDLPSPLVFEASGDRAPTRPSTSNRAWFPYHIRRSMSQQRRSSRSTPVVIRKESNYWGMESR